MREALKLINEEMPLRKSTLSICLVEFLKVTSPTWYCCGVDDLCSVSPEVRRLTREGVLCVSWGHPFAPPPLISLQPALPNISIGHLVDPW